MLSSAQDMRDLTLSSPQNTSASLSSSRTSRFSAKFSRASGKNCAPGILSPSIRMRSPQLSALSPVYSIMAGQNASMSSTDQSYRAVKLCRLSPCLSFTQRRKRVTFAFSIRSFAGCQSKSLMMCPLFPANVWFSAQRIVRLALNWYLVTAFLRLKILHFKNSDKEVNNW